MVDLQAFEEKVRDREVGSDQTVSEYGTWIERFDMWAGADADEETLREFDSFLQDPERPDYPWENARGRPAPEEYAYQTRVKALSAVKLYLKHEHETSVETEVQNIAAGEPAPFDPTVLDPGEVNNVIRNADLACDNPDCGTAIIVGYDAIMRGAEVVNVRAEDFDPGDGTLYVRAVKGSEQAHVALGTDAQGALKRHIKAHPDRDLLFTNTYGNKLTANAWNGHFRRKHHPAGFHAFARHSPITNRLRQGEDFGDVFLRAQHSNPQTTIKYVGLVDGSAPDWVDGR